MNTKETILAMAEQLQPEMTEQRRDFHKHAETGWFEMRTSSIIARKLTDMGYEVLVGEDVCLKDARMGVPAMEKLEKHYLWAAENGADPAFLPATRGGMTGVIGILRCGEGPTVAMRFDIDALGVVESEDEDHRPAKEGFRSVNHGMMHACGHDGHAATGLGVAKVLMAIRENLHGTVKLIFQPAEEGVRGAKSIVEKGHLDNVDYFIGSHISDNAKDAGIHMYPGCYGSLATSKFDVTFRGLAAHAGGSPDLGKNAMLAACTAVLNLNAIPRHRGGITRINVGTLHAGSGRNVIPDEAVMEIELRGETTELNNYMCHKARLILESAAAMYECTCEIKLMGAADSLTSDEALCKTIKESAQSVGLTVSEALMMRSGGSEDVSYMMNRVQEQGGQASYMRTMSWVKGGAHNRRDDFGEEARASGVKMFCGIVADLMK